LPTSRCAARWLNRSIDTPPFGCAGAPHATSNHGNDARVSDHPTDFVGSVEEAIRTAIIAKIPDARVDVSGGGGHYTIGVVSTVFAGKGMLESQRLVLGAIKHLLAGERAPVHAVDSLTTRTP
jgi:acid stress-induced BolA-like protein IbaG/YrbA